MDIGGSLAKIAYYSTVPVKRSVVYPTESTAEKQKNNGIPINPTVLCSTTEFTVINFLYINLKIFGFKQFVYYR